MKTHLKTFIHKPKIVLLTSLIVAGIIGGVGFVTIQKSTREHDLKIQSDGFGGVAHVPSDATTHPLTLGFLAGGRIKTVTVAVGDSVHAGDVLATLDAGDVLGTLTQSKAAYALAQANYQKIINGATGTTIDVAKSAVNTAQVNLNQAKTQQALLVNNAHMALLNTSPVAVSDSANSSDTPPTLSGSYVGTQEGQIKITVYQTGTGGYFNTSGLVSVTGVVSTTTPQPIGDTGLYIKFATAGSQTNWFVSLPNKQATNYLTNYNAYQLALQTQTQVLAQLQAVLDQANANLTALVTAARPEDVKSAQAGVDTAYGALQIAQSAYDATIIKAPYDGIVTAVTIVPGQIALPNALAVELTTNTLSTNK